MVSVIQRALFWRIYLTLLASLLATALLGGLIWHLAVDRPGPMPVSAPGAALGALLPPEAAPKPEIEEAVRRVSEASGGRVMLFDRAGRPAAAAEAGHSASPEAWGWPSRSLHARLMQLGPWRTKLGDGRTLWISVPPDPRPNMGEHMLFMMLTASTLIGVAAFPIVSRLTRRLEALRSSVDAWGEGRLASRAPVEGHDEVAAVAQSFNAAADRVEKLLAAHKSLLAHASHELRSPLTRLRLAVEMLAAGADPELRPGVIRDIAELDALVDEILLASRLDHAAAPPPAETVDLLALAAEEAARAKAALLQPEPAGAAFEVAGSPRLLRRLIRNLVENAAKHGAPPVEVALSRVGDSITVRVDDRGPGIPEAERERVFEPFYRPTGWAEAAGSWGLGLSIVRQIAERHGGSAACEARPGGGASFVVTLPAAR
jgi:signal transduction histidine kinase